MSIWKKKDHMERSEGKYSNVINWLLSRWCNWIIPFVGGIYKLNCLWIEKIKTKRRWQKEN